MYIQGSHQCTMSTKTSAYCTKITVVIWFTYLKDSHNFNTIPLGLFLEPVTTGEGLFDPLSNFKTANAIDM